MPNLAYRTRPAAEQLYEMLREEILTAQLRPGHAISEVRTAEQYGVSRTPVREVFRRLADEGFLRIVPQVGTFVAPIDLEAVYDSQFVRETLECRTVALASERHKAADGRRLKSFLVEQRRAIGSGNRTTFFKLDDALHAHLAAMAGHPSVWTLIQGVKAQLDRVRCLSLDHQDRSETIYREHEEIMDRVLARDPEGAERAMRRHLQSVFGSIEEIARSRHGVFEKAMRSRKKQPGG